MERFAATAEQIASHPGKLDKVAILAEYLRMLDDADLVAATRFFTGTPFAARDHRTLSIGGRTIVEVARRVWRFSDAELGEGYRTTGDLGAALGPLVRPPHDAMLFADRLTPASLAAFFGEIAEASGKRSSRRREAILERVFRACSDPLVATYVIKIVTGDLRVGLREGLVLDAIAKAFDADAGAVRRGTMASGDVGVVALASKHGTLAELRVDYGTPIGFMLATPIPYGEAYKELAGTAWHLEDKYDGIRAQAHVRNGTLKLFAPAQRRDGILSGSRGRPSNASKPTQFSMGRSSRCATAAFCPFGFCRRDCSVRASRKGSCATCRSPMSSSTSWPRATIC